MIRLSKWYFDCVTDDARVFIGYAASLRLFGCPIRWRASQYWDDERHVRQGIGRCRIGQDTAGLSLDIPAHAMQGSWEGGAGLPALSLFEASGISMHWHVLRTGCQTRMRMADHHLHGRGYVERLDIALRRPRLPFAELHWGRFIADDGSRSRVWILWRDGLERSWLLDEQGRMHERIELHADSLRSDGGELRLQASRTLVDNKIASHLPRWLNATVGATLAGGHEHKSLSRACWCDRDGIDTEGWALHEVVRWNERAHA